MAFALLVFWLGRYKFVHRPAQGWGEVKQNFTGVNLRGITHYGHGEPLPYSGAASG